MPVAVMIPLMLFFLLTGRCFSLAGGITAVAARDSILIAMNGNVGYVSYDYGATFDSVEAPEPPFFQAFILANGDALFTYGAKMLVVPKGGPARIETGGSCKINNEIDGHLHQIDFTSKFLCIDATGTEFGISTIEAGLGKTAFTKNQPMDYGVSVNQFEYLDSTHTLMIGSTPTTHRFSTLYQTENGSGKWTILSQLDDRGFSQYFGIRRMSKDIIFVQTGAQSFTISNDNGYSFSGSASFEPFDFSTSLFVKGDYYLLFTPLQNGVTTMSLAEVWFDPLRPTSIRKASQSVVNLEGSTLFTALLGENRVALITDLGTVKILEWDPLPLSGKTPLRKTRSYRANSSPRRDAIGRKRDQTGTSRVRHYNIPNQGNP